MHYNRDYKMIMKEGKRLLHGNIPERDQEPKGLHWTQWAFGAMCLGIIIYLLLLPGCAYSATLDQWADNIRITEGSPTYGIHLYKHGIICPITPYKARIICKRTVLHKFKQYCKQGGNPHDTGAFINYLADRYCPFSVDPIGNLNWKHNMGILMKGE